MTPSEVRHSKRFFSVGRLGTKSFYKTKKQANQARKARGLKTIQEWDYSKRGKRK